MLKFLQSLFAVVLRLVVLASVLLGSCTGLSFAYKNSAYLALAPIDEVTAGNTYRFFVGFMHTPESGERELEVLSYKLREQLATRNAVSFTLPQSAMRYSFGAGEGYARIKQTLVPDGAALVQVMVVGELPWVSVSEYRVVDNTVVPLRYGRAWSWLLAAFFLLPPVVIWLLQKPVRRAVDRLLGRAAALDTPAPPS